MSFLVRSFIVGFFIMFSNAANSETVSNINTFGEGGGFFSDPPKTDTAIKGYDTVAYFTTGKPTKGLDTYYTSWKGAKWKFASQENLNLFLKEPDKYAPQYGGYCAFGVAKGSLVKIEPDQFAIVDGKLFLNYDEGVSKSWKKDKENYIKKANEEFPKLLK